MSTMISEYRLPDGLEGTVLAEIVAARMPEITAAKNRLPAESILAVLDRAPAIRSFKRPLMRRHGVIAEIKRASPSAGLLRTDFNPPAIAEEYGKAGAASISVVTEEGFFQGNLEILAGLRWCTGLPLLRKDFIIDAYQILEARQAGADAVLLIAALHEGISLGGLLGQAERLGMDVLVEVHTEQELTRALEAGATLIGVNNRNLRSFEVSLEICLRLAPKIPAGVVAVAESGIRSAEDIRRLADAGYRGFLIGETLMRAASPGKALAELTSSLRGG